MLACRLGECLVLTDCVFLEPFPLGEHSGGGDVKVLPCLLSEEDEGHRNTQILPFLVTLSVASHSPGRCKPKKMPLQPKYVVFRKYVSFTHS